MINNVLTASRMGTAMRCLRQHFYACEIGLQKSEKSLALRIGSAWAVAMESRWKGKTFNKALSDALPDEGNLDAFSAETIAALLAGYYGHYGKAETVGRLKPEVEFSYELEYGFTTAGKMDGLGVMRTGEPVIIEAKTTKDSVAPGSDYWLRLAFNMQVYQYVLAARREGWDVSKVFYDVTKKPGSKPRQAVDNLDADGKKIVVDSSGNRVFLATGKNKGEPRQSADAAKGYVVKQHAETPDEFGTRIVDDIKARPDFYFCRREVPVLDDSLNAFSRQRLSIAKLIVDLRRNEETFGKDDQDEEWQNNRDADAWPRNVSRDTCNFCQFKNFCLQNTKADHKNIPVGFELRRFNEELTNHDNITTEEEIELADPTAETA